MEPLIRYYVEDQETGMRVLGPYTDRAAAEAHLGLEMRVVELDVRQLAVHPTLKFDPDFMMGPDGQPYAHPRHVRRRFAATSRHAVEKGTKRKKTTRVERKQKRQQQKVSRRRHR